MENPIVSSTIHRFTNKLYSTSCRYFPMVLHLVLKFTEDYPMRPPRCLLKTPIRHGHVFGESLCLDLLETHGSSQPYFGWSSSYSVLSMLFQLQSFLFEEPDIIIRDRDIESDLERSYRLGKCKCGNHPFSGNYYPLWNYWGEKVKKTYFNVKSGKSRRLQEIRLNNSRTRRLLGEPSNVVNSKHRTSAAIERRRRYRRNRRHRKAEERRVMRDHPEVRIEHERKKKLRNEEMKKMMEERKQEKEMVRQRRKELWGQLPSELLISIFSFLDQRELFRFSHVSKTWRELARHPFLWKDEIKCFHSRTDFREDCLGFGLNVQKRYRKIHQISTPLDIIGKHAFHVQKVRKSAWNEPFTHWMPLFIDQKHWRKSEKDFESLVVDIYDLDGFVPHLAVDLCCRLMTSMVVEIMKGELHGSLKAIQGYAYFYRILIYYVSKFPKIRSEIEYNIGKFIQNERYRHKRYVPNLGDFISLVSVSEFWKWEDLKRAFVQEVFDRNSFWISRKRKMIEDEESRKRFNKRKGNLEVSFECVKVSMKFTLFHLRFLERIRGGEAREKYSIGEIAKMYDRRYGNEETRVKDLLQMDMFRVLKVSDFIQFFEYSGFGEMKERSERENRNLIQRKLEGSDTNFKRRGYNRRIDTSGCLLTGKFNMTSEEVRRIFFNEETEGEEEVEKPRRRGKKKKKKKKSTGNYHFESNKSYHDSYQEEGRNYRNIEPIRRRRRRYYSNRVYYPSRNDYIESNQRIGYGKKRKKSKKDQNREVFQQHSRRRR